MFYGGISKRKTIVIYSDNYWPIPTVIKDLGERPGAPNRNYQRRPDYDQNHPGKWSRTYQQNSNRNWKDRVPNRDQNPSHQNNRQNRDHQNEPRPPSRGSFRGYRRARGAYRGRGAPFYNPGNQT